MVGCGGVGIATAGVPAISQIIPQTIAAGSSDATVEIVGSHINNATVVLWNGSPLTTTVVNDTTVSSPVESASVATPGTAQVQLMDSVTGNKSDAVSLSIASSTKASALSVTTTSLPIGTVGTPYSATLTATGGTAPYTWKFTSGNPPPGLSLSANGSASGTPTAAGTYSVGLTVTDSSKPAQAKFIALTVIVSSAPVTASALSISTHSLPAGTIGTAYSQTLQASGGSGTYSWSIASGSLPSGLSLSSAGVISGTPSASGTFPLTVSVSDTSKPVQTRTASLNITVAALPLQIGATSPAAGTVNSAYSQTLSVSGGTPGYVWTLSSGRLPSGLSLSSAGVISGTPSAAGMASFVAAVHDSGHPVQTASLPLSISIAAAPAAPLNISSTSFGQGIFGRPYSATLQVTGGTPGFSWSITSGSLPSGLSLNSATGVISGTPTGGTTSFTAGVRDSGSPAQTASAQMTIGISAAPLAITASALPSVNVGAAYSQTLQATGGTAPYQWSVTSGQLPAGLTLVRSTGTISGTPSAAGTAIFTATATDSSNPVQTASLVMSVLVNPAQSTLASVTPLSVLVPASATGTVGTAFTQSLGVSGGTGPYTWSIASGSLPAGLGLSSAGVISGTPASGSNGSYSVTVSVADAENPAQTTSAAMSITIAAAPATTTPLSILTSTLASGTTGTAYSQTLQVSGGTTSYTWSVTSGSLPAGLSLSTGGAISGTPTTAGTSTFTAKVTDSSSPAQTQSASLSIVVSAPQASTSGTTWYVRPDGGTRYSSNMTSGQCNGQADAPYPGTGVNQPCAFNDVRYLWADGSYNYGTTFPGWGWVIAGGDTVIIRGSIGTGVSYRVGWNSQSTYCDAIACWGITGSPSASGPPPVPSGTAQQHTRILGENYGACTVQSARTQLHGGWGVGVVLSLSGSSYVDLSCLDITDFSNCGVDNDQVSCSSNGTATSDYAKLGITLNNTTTNINLTDIRVHGLASDGIVGSPGGNFVAKDIAIVGNADSGWNADDGSGTTGVGSLLVQNFDISWNGCVEEYPIVDSVPYFSCRDDATGGYGDGFGTASVASPAPGWQVHFDQGTVTYNTQDGLDALHISGPGSTMTDTRVLAYGNEGNQLKVGGATATIQNSVIVGNCTAHAQTIPGRPVPTDDNLGDLCRAGNTAVLVNVTPGDPATFQDNTIFENGSIGLEVEYALGTPDPTDTLLYNNNIFFGFLNSSSGQNPTPIFSNTNLGMLTNSGASWTNNAYYGYRSNWTCPASGESAAQCGDPGLVDETWHPYGYGNMAPASSSSPVVGTGIAVPSILLDYTGLTRPTPPSIGAYEYP